MLKAQVNIHFIVSLLIFLGVIIYLIFTLANSYSFYIDERNSDILYLKAYQVSELLIKDSGYPTYWNSSNYFRVGLASESKFILRSLLASESYVLSQSKINELEKICDTNNVSEIRKFLDSFGLTKNNLALEINYFNGTNVLKCYPGGRNIGLEVMIRRIAVLNGSFVEVVTYVS